MVDSAWHQGVERANTTRPISAAFTLIEKKISIQLKLVHVDHYRNRWWLGLSTTYGAKERQYVNVLETLCS